MTGLRPSEAGWGSSEFEGVKEDHDRAYALSNEILDLRGHRGKSVLEIMCGIGFDALAMAQHGAAVTFVSPSGKCAELTRRYFAHHGVRGTVEVGDPERLRFGEERFDVVVARGILMFAVCPERVVDEIYRVLKPGGKVYAHLHNKYSWYVLLARLSGTKLVHPEKDPPVSRLHSVKDARNLFAGFSSVGVVMDRFPGAATQRSGMWARLYNKCLVPIASVIPRSMLRPFGFYVLVNGQKPLAGDER